MFVNMKGALACPLRAIKMETPIPITIPLSYDTYASLYSQGLLDSYLCETTCPKYPHDCSSQDPPTALELTNSTVDRTAFILEKDDYGIDTVVDRKVKIALVKCPICKCRHRLLPADILPYKRYSLPVIELAVSLYNRGDLSLRQVAWDQLYGERTPEHTTLHGWTEGLGAYCLGRTVGEVAFSVPATRILAELEIRFPQMKSMHSMPVGITRSAIAARGVGNVWRPASGLKLLAQCSRSKPLGSLSSSTVSSLVGAIGSAWGSEPEFAARQLNTLIRRMCDHGTKYR